MGAWLSGWLGEEVFPGEPAKAATEVRVQKQSFASDRAAADGIRERRGAATVPASRGT